MKFGKFIAAQLQHAVSFSLSLGLLAGLLVLLIGRAEGSITLDIDITYIDSIWFLLGIPLVVIVLFLLCSPLSYFIHRGVLQIFSSASTPD